MHLMYKSQSDLQIQCSLPTHMTLLPHPSCLSLDDFLYLQSFLPLNLIWRDLLQNMLFPQNETLLSLMYSHPYPLLEKHQFCLLWSFLLTFPLLWKRAPEFSLPLLDLVLYYSFYLVKLCKHAACTLSLHLLSSNCFHMLLQSVSSTMNWNSSHQGLGYI